MANDNGYHYQLVCLVGKTSDLKKALNNLEQYGSDIVEPVPTAAERAEFRRLLAAERHLVPRTRAGRLSVACSMAIHVCVFAILLSIPKPEHISLAASYPSYPELKVKVVVAKAKPEPKKEPPKVEKLEPPKAKQVAKAKPAIKPKTVKKKKKVVRRKVVRKKVPKPAPQVAKKKPIQTPITSPDETLPAAPAPEEVPANEPVEVAAADSTEDETSEATGSEVEGPDLDALFSGYMRAVHSSVRRNKKYPRAAIRAGIEGRVELALVIDGSGNILECKIHKSSGVSLLDQAAVKSVSRMRNLPRPPSSLKWSRKKIVVPFVYKRS